MNARPFISIAVDHYRPNRGGLESYIHRLTLELIERDFRVQILTQTAEEVPKKAKVFLIAVPRHPRILREWLFIRRAIKLHIKSGFDIFYAVRHTPFADIYHPHGGLYSSAWASSLDLPASPDSSQARRGRPAFFGSGQARRGTPALSLLNKMMRFIKNLSPYRLLLCFFERHLFLKSKSKLIIAVSDWILEDIRHRFPHCKIPAVVLNNPVNLSFYQPSNDSERSFARAALGISDEIVFLFAANNFRLKGLWTTLKTYQKLTRQYPDTILLIAGRDKRRIFEDAISKLGLCGSQNIRFLGWQPDMRKIYHASDIIVLPTRFDPMPVTLLEGAASRLPIITSSQNGMAHFIKNTGAGFVVSDPHDTEGFFQSMVKMMDPGLRKSIGQASFEMAQEFDEKNHFNKLIDLMKNISPS